MSATHASRITEIKHSGIEIIKIQDSRRNFLKFDKFWWDFKKKIVFYYLLLSVFSHIKHILDDEYSFLDFLHSSRILESFDIQYSFLQVDRVFNTLCRVNRLNYFTHSIG